METHSITLKNWTLVRPSHTRNYRGNQLTSLYELIDSVNITLLTYAEFSLCWVFGEYHCSDVTAENRFKNGSLFTVLL